MSLKYLNKTRTEVPRLAGRPIRKIIAAPVWGSVEIPGSHPKGA